MCNPELFFLFFAIRSAKLLTLITHKEIELSESSQKAVGLRRFVSSGRVYFEYKGSRYPENVAVGNAVNHIKQQALKHCKGLGLDIGCKIWPLDGAIGVDNKPEENAYKLDRWDDETLDFVFSSHCLEHLEKWEEALTLWCKKVKPGGVIFLYLPHSSMELWKPGSAWVGDDHKWSPTVHAITPIFEKNGFVVEEAEDTPDHYWSFHILAKKSNG